MVADTEESPDVIGINFRENRTSLHASLRLKIGVVEWWLIRTSGSCSCHEMSGIRIQAPFSILGGTVEIIARFDRADVRITMP